MILPASCAVRAPRDAKRATRNAWAAAARHRANRLPPKNGRLSLRAFPIFVKLGPVEGDADETPFMKCRLEPDLLFKHFCSWPFFNLSYIDRTSTTLHCQHHQRLLDSMAPDYLSFLVHPAGTGATIFLMAAAFNFYFDGTRPSAAALGGWHGPDGSRKTKPVVNSLTPLLHFSMMFGWGSAAVESGVEPGLCLLTCE